MIICRTGRLTKFRRPPGPPPRVMAPLPELLRLMEATSKVGVAACGAAGACASSETMPAARAAPAAIHRICRAVPRVMRVLNERRLFDVAEGLPVRSSGGGPPHIYYNC